MRNPTPSPLQTVRAVALGYLPRVLQPRGWALCAMALLPPLLTLLGQAASRQLGGSRDSLGLFHGTLVAFILPIMALVAAPGGIREDLEQRTLPLLLVRPVRAWALPLAKGLVWYGWGALWLGLGCLGLLLLGSAPGATGLQALALVFGFWAEFSFVSLLGLVFSRGTLWGAVVLFGWENLARALPPALQPFSFLHHLESISGSRGGAVANLQFLAQDQASGSPWVSMAALFLFGALCWALSGWKLQRTPIGLAGMEAEG